MLNQLQGRIFGLLYLNEEPLSLDDIARELQQSKSNISVQIRGLVEWHLVHRVKVEGSRKDHYLAASDLWRVMQSILERRFRWNLRQVIAAADEAERAQPAGGDSGRAKFVNQRLATIRNFSRAVEGIAAFSQGQVFAPESVRSALRLVSPRKPKDG